MTTFARMTKAEKAATQKILDRVCREDPTMDARRRVNLWMDLSATHATCPLRLKELADADGFNFWHDIGGISKHLDRDTGELTGCFVPRYAR